MHYWDVKRLMIEEYEANEKAKMSSKEWPDSEERINIIGHNGNTGDHYTGQVVGLFCDNDGFIIKITKAEGSHLEYTMRSISGCAAEIGTYTMLEDDEVEGNIKIVLDSGKEICLNDLESEAVYLFLRTMRHTFTSMEEC